MTTRPMWVKVAAGVAVSVAILAAGFGIGREHAVREFNSEQAALPVLEGKPVDSAFFCGDRLRIRMEDGEVFWLRLVGPAGGPPTVVPWEPFQCVEDGSVL